MVDAVQGSSPDPWPKSLVYSVAKALVPSRPAWLEEPFRIENPGAYAELRGAVPYPIAGAESATSVAEIMQFLAAHSLDILQPDLTVAGGFTLTKRMAALAEAHHLKIAQHCWGGGVSLMANLHFGFSQPSCIWVEHPMYKSPLRDDLLAEPLEIKNGSARPPTLPGLGVHITEETVQKYGATGTERAGLVFEMN
jgi:L-alanine-DL-glutamate epimerase-like enolase superfamily enzyme